MRTKKETRHPSTCSGCRHGTLVPTAPGNPRIVQCKVFNRRFVADSPRNCTKAE